MSVERTIKIYCDGDAKSCPTKGKALGDADSQILTAKAQIEAAGWVQDGTKVFCPDCYAAAATAKLEKKMARQEKLAKDIAALKAAAKKTA